MGIFSIYWTLPPTVYVPAAAPMGKDRARNSCDVHISADCTLCEMRIVASCQNALSFHGQRNRWDPPLPPPSPSQGPQHSPHGKWKEKERKGGDGFNQLASCSRISDLRSTQRFPDPEIRNLRCFVRPQSASPASLHQRLNKRLEIPNSSRCFLSIASWYNIPSNLILQHFAEHRVCQFRGAVIRRLHGITPGLAIPCSIMQ